MAIAGLRRRALARAARDLRIVVQPIIDLSDDLVVGHEALSRFPHGQPQQLFAEAHRRGVGIDLERAAVRMAIDGAPATGYLSVNVSPLTAGSPAFVSLVRDAPEPHRLVVELTEHTMVGDYDRLCRAIARLRDVGIRLAVDDAGGGISSFRHILMISPDIIKLDRSLIAGLDSHPGRQALADAMVQFAARMGVDLVAEGIEREEERVACVDHGIRYGQGYLLGVPSPVHGLDRRCRAAD
jgi:EAL domain-containing protein (putative c-di-GMP-specific phosphodiesterase class I)